MMKVESQRCKICGGSGKIVHKGTRDNANINVYECVKCGTKFLVSEENYKRDYESGYMHQSVANIVSETMSKKQISEDDIRRYYMVCNECSGKRILDFGCGFGGFLLKIKPDVKECFGVELGQKELEYISTHGIECKKNIEEYSMKFDVITLFHVFEHLENPKEWLLKFSEYLVPGGKLIIEVPNSKDALLELYKNKKFADFTYWSAHLFLYTSESLTQLINSTHKYNILEKTQIQRYSIANHLYWLAEGKPGGQAQWKNLDSRALNDSYAEKLRELGMCDTLYFVLERNVL